MALARHGLKGLNGLEFEVALLAICGIRSMIQYITKQGDPLIVGMTSIYLIPLVSSFICYEYESLKHEYPRKVNEPNDLLLSHSPPAAS